MMEYDEMLTVLSQCFAPLDERRWAKLTAGPTWSDFLDAARRALQDPEPLGPPSRPIARARARCPLQEFLSAGEVRALFAPPSFDEVRGFAARHFTGGLPKSAMPVESLYTRWSGFGQPAPFSKSESRYQGDTARYLRDLVERMGMRVPPEFSAYPDHLALELDLAAVLMRSGRRDAAADFALERFAWLTAYRMRLLELDDGAGFFIGLVDVLIGVRENLAALREAPATAAREGAHGADGQGEESRFPACIERGKSYVRTCYHQAKLPGWQRRGGWACGGCQLSGL